MGLFKWIPDDGDQMISPFAALYLGLTVSMTAGLWWRWRKQMKEQEKKASKEVIEVVESDTDTLKVIKREAELTV